MVDEDQVFEAVPDLDARLLVELRAMPYFRVATAEEIDASFTAYAAGDIEGLIREWARVAEPSRATLPPMMAWAYARAGMGPRVVNASLFLESLRAVLRAGERFREGLSAEVQAALRVEFPYLERRHEHVPEGETPSFEFPGVFAEFIEWGTLDDSRARWQLAVGLNEVQQCCYSDYAAGLFGLPELRRHAERERALARNYFGHWAPRCTKELWRETIYVLDALNAATFELVCTQLIPRAMAPTRLLGSRSRREQWRAFVAGLETPQWLLPVPGPSSRGPRGH
ncbi:hypothetical protein ENSA5_33670 [Enhygromyxa salina]|uniref:Uncharacterized protein n=1 Tax=Enhygromyxa salina TaxID=215803 RepID=A0A2S9XXA8_9BACT|nr:hypothetical protein [Enhygromyxa salina]PRP97474.1 hypothetical protein ENSA5_33670 [Enhygromyxa salina]